MSKIETLELPCGATISLSTYNKIEGLHRFRICDPDFEGTISEVTDIDGKEIECEQVTILIYRDSLPAVIALLQRALKENP